MVNLIHFKYFLLSLVLVKCEDYLNVIEVPNLGKLRGSQSTTAWTTTNIHEFFGIPFAESPSGSRRFKEPIPAKPWDGIRSAEEYGIPCPELTSLQNMNTSNDLEDCLHLSVYTKNFSASYPVMFFVHGGGFTNGSSRDHPPNFLLENDVVLVVTQYRLGPLGFLSTRTEDIPGNVALLDIVLALKWVQQYIGVFGGDPSRVTIFGQSAGAEIIGLLAISPAVPQGLFHQIILQSGSPMTGWTTEPYTITKASRLANRLGCSPLTSINDMNICLIATPLFELFEASNVEDISYIPTLNDLNNIVPANINELLTEESKINNMPLMAGVTKHDGSFAFAEFYTKFMAYSDNGGTILKPRKLIELMLKAYKETDQSGIITNLLIETLFTPKQIAEFNINNMIPGFIDMANIVVMKAPLLRLLQKHANYNKFKSFLYTFDYEGEHNFFGYEYSMTHYPFEGGVHHSNELIYIFPTKILNKNDFKMAKRMTELWASFAMTGQPSTNEQTVSWPPFDFLGPYIHINEEFSIGENFLDEFFVTVRNRNNSLLRPDVE